MRRPRDIVRAAVSSLACIASIAATDCARPAREPSTNSGSTARSAAHSTARILPARVRRLTNVEIERTWSAIFGEAEHVADRLPADVRQEGYTRNADQQVSAAWAARLDAVLRDAAHRAVQSDLAKLAPCAAAGTGRGAGDEACARSFVRAVGRRAWRRPLDANEQAALLRAFAAGSAEGAGFVGGAEAVLTALLESPSALYVTELGERSAARPADGDVVTLGRYEIASLLSYTIRGGPPDEALLDAAEKGELSSADAREAQARRLLAESDTREQFRRFVLEWLEVDALDRTAKDEKSFPGYDALKSHMLDETTAFVDEVMVYAGGSVRALLDAGFASVDPPMARFYGLSTWGPRASLRATRRGGVLQQASFLAAHAHEDETSPVLRGDFVLRKVLCVRVPRPAEVGIEVVFPPPSVSRTTRERFAAHVTDPSCSGCHAKLDPFGDVFEGFDAMGRSRTSDNGRPVDAAATIPIEGQPRRFADSLQLSQWLATRPEVAGCFARQAFRYFSAQSDAGLEASFDALREGLEPSKREDLFEALVAYVRSEAFVRREVRSP